MFDPDVLCIGMTGFPKQVKKMVVGNKATSKSGDRISRGKRGFDYYAGVTPRAPKVVT
jgi:UDP-N-acetyl-D-mannosaminuronic acid transferase (WecB/TagA/CpsF family)